MQPCLLIASPQMKDPFFEKAVVLVWHHDENGAIGVVVNRPLEHQLSDVLTLPGIDLEDHDDATIAWGGPVESTSGTVLTTEPVDDDQGWNLDRGVSVTRSEDALRKLIEQGARLFLCLGYAGWGPGQLDKEIEAGGWLWTDLDTDLLFESPMDERYEKALATLGLTPNSVWMRPVSE